MCIKKILQPRHFAGLLGMSFKIQYADFPMKTHIRVKETHDLYYGITVLALIESGPCLYQLSVATPRTTRLHLAIQIFSFVYVLYYILACII